MYASGENSDRIGELGELEFKKLCNQANLFCSKVEPDRTGKDFIVEFRLESLSKNISYDKRPTPKQIIVQVKTISEKSNKVSLSLSVAERLAKDPRPAIVCALKIDRSDNFINMYFIELIDKNLAKILKRLREEYLGKNEKLHKSELSFSISNAYSVDRTPAAIYAKMATLASPSMEEYMEKKIHQTKYLGFDEHRYSLKFNFDGETEEDIVDGLLGLKPLKILDHSETEIRFNVPLPHSGLLANTAGSTISFEPQPDEAGTLVVKDKASQREASVPATWRAVPQSLVPNAATALIRWQSGSLKLNFYKAELNAKICLNSEAEMPPSDWIRELQFLTLLFTEKCKLIIQGIKGKIELGSLNWPNHISTNDHTEIIKQFLILDNIFKIANAENVKISLKAIFKSQRYVKILSDLQNKNIRITAYVKNSPNKILPTERGIFISATQIGKFWIGFSMPMIVTTHEYEGEIKLEGTKDGELHFEMIAADVESAFESFRRKTMKISNARCAFVQRPGDFLSEDRTLIEFA